MTQIIFGIGIGMLAIAGFEHLAWALIDPAVNGSWTAHQIIALASIDTYMLTGATALVGGGAVLIERYRTG
mgnify:CR=1 FL=1|jgi:hypothetical protein